MLQIGECAHTKNCIIFFRNCGKSHHIFSNNMEIWGSILERVETIFNFKIIQKLSQLFPESQCPYNIEIYVISEKMNLCMFYREENHFMSHLLLYDLRTLLKFLFTLEINLFHSCRLQHSDDVNKKRPNASVSLNFYLSLIISFSYLKYNSIELIFQVTFCVNNNVFA